MIPTLSKYQKHSARSTAKIKASFKEHGFCVLVPACVRLWACTRNMLVFLRFGIFGEETRLDHITIICPFIVSCHRHPRKPGLTCATVPRADRLRNSWKCAESNNRIIAIIVAIRSCVSRGNRGNTFPTLRTDAHNWWESQ